MKQILRMPVVPSVEVPPDAQEAIGRILVILSRIEDIGLRANIGNMNFEKIDINELTSHDEGEMSLLESLIESLGIAGNYLPRDILNRVQETLSYIAAKTESINRIAAEKVITTNQILDSIRGLGKEIFIPSPFTRVFNEFEEKHSLILTTNLEGLKYDELVALSSDFIAALNTTLDADGKTYIINKIGYIALMELIVISTKLTKRLLAFVESTQYDTAQIIIDSIERIMTIIEAGFAAFASAPAAFGSSA